MYVLLNILKASRDACLASILILFELDFVADEDADTIHSHLTSEICKNNLFTILELNSEERIRQRFNYYAFKNFLCLVRSIHANEHVSVA